MIDNIINIQTKEHPVLLDKIIQELQVTLETNLKWLNHAFGRAYRLVEHKPDGNKFVYPAVYIGKGEYISVNPNDNFGNFSWFDIYDPQEIKTVVQSLPQIKVNGAIVFWFNLKSIYNDDSLLYTEDVKDEIIRLLASPSILQNTGRIEINRIYESFENIYKNYSIEKIYSNYMYSGEDIQSIDKQFFMYPYAGLRIEFSIITRELCQRFSI